MQIRKIHNQIFQVTLSGYELATLISSARWAVEGAQGELATEAVTQLKQVLANYDNATKKIEENLMQKE